MREGLRLVQVCWSWDLSEGSPAAVEVGIYRIIYLDEF